MIYQIFKGIFRQSLSSVFGTICIAHAQKVLFPRFRGKSSDIAIRFGNSNFLKESNNLAIRRYFFQCFFFTAQIRDLPHYFQSIWPNDFEHVSRCTVHWN